METCAIDNGGEMTVNTESAPTRTSISEGHASKPALIPPRLIPRSIALVLITERKQCAHCKEQYAHPSAIVVKIEHKHPATGMIKKITYAPAPPDAVEQSVLPREKHYIDTTVAACDLCFTTQIQDDQLDFLERPRYVDLLAGNIPAEDAAAEGKGNGTSKSASAAAVKAVRKQRGDELLAGFLKGDF